MLQLLAGTSESWKAESDNRRNWTVLGQAIPKVEKTVRSIRCVKTKRRQRNIYE